jgi:outer membrane receptor protein involved in Fe transport
MLSRFLRVSGVVSTAILLVPAYTSTAFAAQGRQIEEVVVTAERRESTVQDTAISITAFTGEFIEDFGIRNQEDLQNYIPATTIQPYDLSIRGVGRLFRALGGDPGIATYFDGAYSEDFGIASTEGGLFDLERIEVLRGPQGTLYGRNGVGGAVNFHSKRPTDEFEGEIKVVVGTYEQKEIFSVLSGPLIPGLLNARATAVKRTRDGFMNDLEPGNPDINNYGDENYSLSLDFNPSEQLNIYLRGNERSYRRMMSGAAGAGAIVVSEQGGLRDPVSGGERWTSVPVHGWRQVQDPMSATATLCAGATDRSVADCIVPTGIVPYINATAPGSIQGTGVYQFELNGITRFGQPLVAGVDTAGVAADGTDTSGFSRPNYAYQAFGLPDELRRADRSIQGNGRELPELKGDELDAWTNGFQDEFFDHQAAYLGATWDVADWLTIKYIGAYTDYFYDRTTEDDRTGLPHDQQFYAAQENENFQHEIQVFADLGEDITLTGGFFYYENDIDQQLDFYSTDSWSRYTSPDNIYGGLTPTDWLAGDATAFLFIGDGHVNHRTAQNVAPVNLAGAIAIPSFSDPNITEVQFADGGWRGDTLATAGRVDHGPVSDGTTFIWDTENRTEAWAVYLQGEWQINETWAITLGARYAEDDKEAEENLFLYQESISALGTCVTNRVAAGGTSAECGDGNADGIVTLAEYNQNITGGIDASGNVIDFDRVRMRGVPYSRSIYRSIENEFDEVTYRINFDYTPTEDDLIYLSMTTGYRAGGFNLGYFSFIPTYEPEDITAYELGYKGQLLDGTLQLNASIYYYDYEGIHLQYSVSSFTGVSYSVRNAPGAITIGGEVEALWLAGDNLTIGATYSYTDAKYDGELIEPTTGTTGVVDGNNPYAPSSLYTVAERNFGIDDEPLPRVPEHKFTGWAEYVVQLGDNGKLTFLTSVSYTGEFQAAGRPVPESPLSLAPDYIRWDARASWSSANDQWGVSAFVNNITNDIGVRNQFDYGEAEGHRRVIEPTNPRMAGLEIQYKFGAYQ